ncbi:hypothetical protein [Urbifossiella limnaea]|uniref:Type II toxin-antitoxin system RelE/ParE family toxin n=1 Tax=Urbifossiella limnaea TaxID=2528023 RepID=A0A517Y2K1_9BACT|nr:hypothetical protein [Urbifossiella limnaea]QDU23928.1 hypothetical protein ETAA1_59390 [Urbifossiella limnaea]
MNGLLGMTYAVVWTVATVQELARIQAAEADAARVAAAANRIDFALRRTPHDMGESREKGYRLWYEDVLGVRYYVDDAAMRVEVLSVGPARRR